jgi:Flp pilus assembly protein TadG
MTVTDTAGNVSNSLTISSFTDDITASTLRKSTAVTTPTNDKTPDYKFYSSKAGIISYGGSCSSSTTAEVSGTNTITLNILSTGTYSNCNVTVTVTVSNSITINMSSFSVFEQMGGSIQSGLELSLSTVVSTLAGTGSSGYTNGTGTSASFNNPRSITTDGSNLYVA